MSQGAASKNLESIPEDAEKFYLTTAISYTNGYPHIGHAYEFIISDILARYYRIYGYRTFFLTGADEHGQKVATSAEKAGRTPKDHCDIFVEAFKRLDSMLNISFDRYIRTTDEDHVKTSQLLWDRCKQDIYLGSYEGWYNEREECFVSDADATASDFKDIGSGLPLKLVKEESYFFKMSLFCDRLIEYIENFPDFIQPELHRNSILYRLRNEGLKDLSISRTSFNWGIPVPNHPEHVMYVWFDALANYLSGIDGLNSESSLATFWPPNVHIIGKDIIWFHCVIWPCILMSAGISLPKCVFSHGFVNASDGRKMSKSFNNTIDPFDVLQTHSSDSVRYYVAASVTLGADINFSNSSLVSMHNNELADILGNLVHRIMNLCKNYSNSEIPNVEHDPEFGLPFNMAQLMGDVFEDVKRYNVNLAIFKAMEAARATNGFLQRSEPWKLKGPENERRRRAIVRTALESLYAFNHLLAPVIPLAAHEIFQRLNTKPISVRSLNAEFYNLSAGVRVEVGNILFTKFPETQELEPIDKLSAACATQKVEDDDIDQPNFSKLDFRVGKIVKIWPLENSDKLYCEEIDFGEPVPRIIVSGLRHHYSMDDLINRLVVALVNVKEAKIAGALSNGLVLAASSSDGKVVQLIDPPSGSCIGEKIFADTPGIPVSPAKVKKQKIWESVKTELSVNHDGIVCWRNIPLSTNLGVCSTLSLIDAHVF